MKCLTYGQISKYRDYPKLLWCKKRNDIGHQLFNLVLILLMDEY